MKKVNKFLALLAMAIMFVGCNDDEPTQQEPQGQNEQISYVGTMVVVQKDETNFTQQNVVVDYEITDADGLVLTFKQVSFSPKMPVKLDMAIKNVQYVENGEITSFTGTDIIPYAMGGPFEAYIVTNLSGTIQDGTMSLSMTCGSNPITYSGTIACDL